MAQLTMRGAVEIFGLDCDTSKRVVNIVCPICGTNPREKKMNINFDRFGLDDGAFRCVKCGAAGRPMNFWAMMRGLDIADVRGAASDYYKYTKDHQIEIKVHPATTSKRIDVDIASVATRNATYQALLNMLDLSDNHLNQLRARGLDDATIQRNMYRSYPMTALSDLTQLLLSKGYVLQGVPGFYTKKNGEWSMLRFGSGFLIPQRDGFGRIQGMQIRLDNGTKSRYLTVSTGETYVNGAKGQSCCHLAKGKDIKEIILTEGPLKGDIISYYTGKSVLAIPGVNALSYLKRALYDLKKAGMEKVMIAYDMDLYENPYVMRALKNLMSMLNDLRIPHTQLVWDRAYKGLDDYLLHQKTQ